MLALKICTPTSRKGSERKKIHQVTAKQEVEQEPEATQELEVNQEMVVNQEIEGESRNTLMQRATSAKQPSTEHSVWQFAPEHERKRTMRRRSEIDPPFSLLGCALGSSKHAANSRCEAVHDVDQRECWSISPNTSQAVRF
jgi:hypothetical protein